jgi:hypothetical protein
MRSAHLAAVAASALALVAPGAASAKGRTLPGLWEISATVELPVGGAMPPSVQTECLSQDDVDADPLPEFEKGACKASEIRRRGDRVTWRVDCGALGQGGGELHYVSPTAWEGSLSLTSSGLPVRATFKARRLGDCKAGAR